MSHLWICRSFRKSCSFSWFITDSHYQDDDDNVNFEVPVLESHILLYTVHGKYPVMFGLMFYTKLSIDSYFSMVGHCYLKSDSLWSFRATVDGKVKDNNTYEIQSRLDRKSRRYLTVVKLRKDSSFLNRQI